MSFAHVIPSADFWRRTAAMLIKEFIQLRRDRVSFAMIVMIPIMQLLLFGYAINTTPRHMPTVVLLQEQSDVGRSILKAIENTAYFRVVRQAHDAAEFDQLLKSGTVLFGVEVPAEFERALRRGDRPALLFAADATDPVASSTAIASLGQIVQTALANDHAIPDQSAGAFEIRAHARYNPAASTALNIVPGLVGTILTRTMLIFTALSVTREIERGTMENLLAMPITPVEVMLGKIIPYVLVGFIQAALIVTQVGWRWAFFIPAAVFIVSGIVYILLVPDEGRRRVPPPTVHDVVLDRRLTITVVALFMMLALFSGLADLRYDALALTALMLVAMAIAVMRFRRTLD